MKSVMALLALSLLLTAAGCGGRGGATEENPVHTGEGSVTNSDGGTMGGGRVDQGGGTSVVGAKPEGIGEAAPANSNTPPIKPRKSATASSPHARAASTRSGPERVVLE